MVGRRKRSISEDLLDQVALLPWWVGVTLAVTAYLAFHALASSTPAAGTMQPGRVTGFVVMNLLARLAGVLQFVVPVLCLVAAAVSYVQRRQRQALLQGAVDSPALEVVAGLSWREFEQLVGEGFRQQGFRVEEVGGAGPDGGVDLVLRKQGEVLLVQCKHWRARKVGVDVVRELYGVMAARGAAGGFVVTGGTFTADAEAFAQGRNVRLLDGAALQRLLRQAKHAVQTE